MTFTEPMLAVSLLPPQVECNDNTVFAAMQTLRYPVWATLKCDGVRGLRLNGTLMSRRLKLIPNHEIRERAKHLPAGLDMELWNKSLGYNDIQSIVMSRVHAWHDQIKFQVIDWFKPLQPSMSYAERCYHIGQWMHDAPAFVKFQVPVVCDTPEQLFAYERRVIEEEGEGICFRTPNSPYKFGRSTLSEQWLVKLTRQKYDEAVILGFYEQMENTNSSKTDARGKSERSSHQENLVGKDTLGAMLVRNTAGQEFTIGTGLGMTIGLRKKMWENQTIYLGRTIKYKCKEHGIKVLPRAPVFLGFRDLTRD